MNAHHSDPHKIRPLAAALGPWHQKIELTPGVFSCDHAPAHNLKPALRQAGVSGGSVLDIACNAGLHSLQAFACGARRVFSFDARTQWTAQADFVRKVYGIDDDVWTIRNLDADYCLPNCEAFDVVIAKGILYHVGNPIAFLREIARIARRAIIINTARAPGLQPGFSIRLENPALSVSGLNTHCWYPTGLDVLRAFFTHPGAAGKPSQWRAIDAWETADRCQIILTREPKQ